MHHDPSDLLTAVSEACGHAPDISSMEGRLTLQRGCYILNSRGCGPFYDYDIYIRGPYSRELADDMWELGAVPSGGTGLPEEEEVSMLKGLFLRGPSYVEAYATALLLVRMNPGVPRHRIAERATELKPGLAREVREALDGILGPETRRTVPGRRGRDRRPGLSRMPPVPSVSASFPRFPALRPPPRGRPTCRGCVADARSATRFRGIAGIRSSTDQMYL